MKKEIARVSKSTNVAALSAESEKLDLIQTIATAVRDMSAVVAGTSKGASQDDIIQRVAACDDAGLFFGVHIRTECVKSRIENTLQHCKYDELLNMLSESSDEFKPLIEAGMQASDLKEFAVELLERSTLTLLETIPEEKHNSKIGIKAKAEVGSFLDIALDKCHSADYLGSGFTPQAEAFPCLEQRRACSREPE